MFDSQGNDVYVKQLIVSGNSVAYCRNINIVCEPDEDPIVRVDDGVLVLHRCSTMDEVPNPNRGKIINKLIGLLETFHGIVIDVIIPSLVSPNI